MALKILKIIAVVLVIATLGLTCYNLVSYGKGYENCAIILIHGTMGGGLVDANNNPIWDPYGGDHTLQEFWSGGADAVSMVMDLLFGEKYTHISNEVIEGILTDNNSLFRKLASDEDGNVQNNGIVAATADSPIKYGAFNGYKPIYDGLYNDFSKYMDVVMFQYDWRQDNRISGQDLEKFINDNKWDKVILVAHSMGNIVVSNYLVSEANRAKVKAYMAVAGPFLGAGTSIDLLENLDAYVKGVTDMINNNPTFKYLLGDSLDEVIENQIKPLLYNMASVAQLLPTIEFATSLKEYYGDTFLTVDGKEITTNRELIDFYLSRPWAFKSNSSLRAFVADLEEYFNSFYTEIDGVRYHCSELVNTTYFAGSERSTLVGVKIADGKFLENVRTDDGDGTVPLCSATLGKDLSKAKNINIYPGGTHGYIGMMYEGQFGIDLAATIRYLL